MKRLKLKLEGIGEILTKEQMRRVLGGYDSGSNPNCDGTYDTTWYCCTGGGYTTIGYGNCNWASDQCHSKLTNDPSRC